MEPAPFFHDETPAPAGARAQWVTCPDGVRIRLGVLGRGGRGTVLCFPGRTEYLEKYGPLASRLAAEGYGMLAVDWRGQGLSPKLVPGRGYGHVARFSDYQRDVAAMLDLARAETMPRPWFLLAHSMGGCIGLRALHCGLDVAAAYFSAPMWELQISPILRPVARVVPWLAEGTGFSSAMVPGSGRIPYVLAAAPEDNLLTTCPDTFRWFADHVRAHPELGLMGPTLRWLREAMAEFDAFLRLPAPPLPCRVALGSDEAIIGAGRVRRFAASWDSLSLLDVPEGRHEVLMERAPLRDRVVADMLRFFDSVPR